MKKIPIITLCLFLLISPVQAIEDEDSQGFFSKLFGGLKGVFLSKDNALKDIESSIEKLKEGIGEKSDDDANAEVDRVFSLEGDYFKTAQKLENYSLYLKEQSNLSSDQETIKLKKLEAETKDLKYQLEIKKKFAVLRAKTQGRDKEIEDLKEKLEGLEKEYYSAKIKNLHMRIDLVEKKLIKEKVSARYFESLQKIRESLEKVSVLYEEKEYEVLDAFLREFEEQIDTLESLELPENESITLQAEVHFKKGEKELSSVGLKAIDDIREN